MERVRKFKKFKSKKCLQKCLDEKKVDHIRCPCDPMKQLYKETLKELYLMILEEPDFEDLHFEIEYFKELFEVKE